MKFQDLYDGVLAEFDAQTALCVVQIYTINLLLPIRQSELLKRGLREKRIIKKAKKLLWEVDVDIVEQAIRLWRVSYDWEIRQSLHGLGGCKKKTFKELLQKQIHAGE